MFTESTNTQDLNIVVTEQRLGIDISLYKS